MDTIRPNELLMMEPNIKVISFNEIRNVVSMKTGNGRDCHLPVTLDIFTIQTN
jgi:hypothetical protein